MPSDPSTPAHPQSPGRPTVRFVLDGRVVERDGIAPATTLLALLRDDLGRTGTKEGCAEGDCGACTVLLGRACGHALEYRPVNACIRFAATVDGCEVVTSESLVQPDGSLHPVQQAMVDLHASQCGFCTPGFVMSLAALYLARDAVERDEVVEAIAGNLCRCTGYRPIVDAGLAMHRAAPPLTFARRASDADEDRRRLIESLDDGRVLALDAGAGFVAPRTREQVDAALATAPDALLLAGGTDIGLWVTQQLRELPHLIFLGAVDGLDAIEPLDDGRLRIGAGASLEVAYAALEARWPTLRELGRRFASPPIRTSGTLGGNIANGSPIGDSMPMLLALGATLELRRAGARRTLALDEFYLGYRRTALEPGEWLEAVQLPPVSARLHVASYKVAKRFEQDISAVCLGIAVDVDEAGRVVQARIAFGGMAAVPQRAANAERAWIGAAFDDAAAVRAADALADDFAPIDDVRASAHYRMTVARNLLRRFALEHGDASADARRGPTRVIQLHPVAA